MWSRDGSEENEGVPQNEPTPSQPSAVRETIVFENGVMNTGLLMIKLRSRNRGPMNESSLSPG